MSNVPVIRKRSTSFPNELEENIISDETKSQHREEILVLLTQLVAKIIRHSESLNIRYEIGPQTTLFIISIDPRDFGSLVGKSGATIQSLRTLLKAMMGKTLMRGVIQIDSEVEAICIPKK